MDIKILASGSSGNCYRISDGKTSLLLDAGIPIRKIRVGCSFRLSEIAGCLVTHYHGDHSKAVSDLLRHSVDVYMTGPEAEAAGLENHHRLHSLGHTENGSYTCFHIETWIVQPFRTEHDTPEPVGFLLASEVTGEKLLYFTDSYYVHYCFSGLTHIIAECNYDDETLYEQIRSGSTPAARAKRLFTSHMGLDNFLEFLRSTDASRLQQIYICHMSDNHGNEDKIRTAVQKLTGAEVIIC